MGKENGAGVGYDHPMPLDVIKLRRRIEKAGKTHREVAAKAGMPRQHLTCVLRKGTDSLSLIERIARVLRCNVAAILTREGNNATDAAFNRNVEFLIKLTGSKSKNGVSALLERKEEDGADGSVTFADLLTLYHRTAQPVRDLSAEQLDQILDKLRLQLAAAGLCVRVQDLTNASTSRYSMTLIVPDTTYISWSDMVTVHCRPVTLREELEIALSMPLQGQAAIFTPISFEAISSFWAFRLEARQIDVARQASFVLNLPLVNAPQDRENRILLSLLRNREQLLRYLLMLLSNDEDAASRLTNSSVSW